MPRNLKLLIVSLVAAGALLGCISSRTIRSQTDFVALPATRGVYGGSLMMSTWSYAGSDTSYDHFDYTYTRDNLAKHIHVRVVRGMVALDFEARPYRLPGDGVPVTANRLDGRVTGFKIDTNTLSFLRRAVRFESDIRGEK